MDVCGFTSFSSCGVFPAISPSDNFSTLSDFRFLSWNLSCLESTVFQRGNFGLCVLLKSKSQSVVQLPTVVSSSCEWKSKDLAVAQSHKASRQRRERELDAAAPPCSIHCYVVSIILSLSAPIIQHPLNQAMS